MTFRSVKFTLTTNNGQVVSVTAHMSKRPGALWFRVDNIEFPSGERLTPYGHADSDLFRFFHKVLMDQMPEVLDPDAEVTA